VRQNREEDFRAGLEVLMPFFEARDFGLRVYPPFLAEEGTYFSAQFTWGNHAVTLVHLLDLGSVTYSIGAVSMEHEAYLDALRVKRGAAFPAADDDSVSGYAALLSDLETRMTPFFEEPDRDFVELAAVHGRQGRARIPGS